MRPFVWLLALSVAAGTLLAPAGGAGAQLLITGNDEKISFDETGKTVTHPPGKDTVSIVTQHRTGTPARAPVSCCYCKSKRQFAGVPFGAERDPSFQTNGERNQSVNTGMDGVPVRC